MTEIVTLKRLYTELEKSYNLNKEDGISLDFIKSWVKYAYREGKMEKDKWKEQKIKKQKKKLIQR